MLDLAHCRELLGHLDAEVQGASVAELPVIVGELERLRALAWSRLAMPSAPAAAVEDVLLEMPEVARRLGIKEAQAREMGRRGELPVVHVGERHVRVRASALAGWIAQRERGTVSPRRA